MSSRSSFVVGIDVGGTRIAAGVVEFPHARLDRRRLLDTEPEKGGAKVLDKVERLAAELIAEAADDGQVVRDIGLAVCELVDSQGRIRSSSAVSWEDQPVVARLSRLAHVTLQADVRAAALAEVLFGAGRGRPIILFVSVGTGIASTLVIDGRPFTGAQGLTGTFGSSPRISSAGADGMLRRFTLEELASGPALLARYNQKCRKPLPTTAALVAASVRGDLLARQVLHSAADILGQEIGHLVNVMDPSAVVVGGGLGLAEGFPWEGLVESARRQIWSKWHREVPIVRGEQGSCAGVLGAAATAWGG